MRRIFLLCFLLVAAVATTSAQQTINHRSSMLSPELLDSGRVAFRLVAPDAQKVELTGDMLTKNVALTQREDGVWEYISEPLPSNYYNYNFIVDGARIIDPANVHTVRDIASMFSLLIVPGEKGDMFAVQGVPHGSVSRVWYGVEDKQHSSRRMSIYTPPGYAEGKQRYPVLYLLHGMGGDEEAWLGLGRAAQIFDNMIAAGRMEPMIVVMPNGNMAQEAAPGESREGLIRPDGRLPRTMDGSYEESFYQIINYVDKHYRTVAKATHRAVAGLSMGGFHSLHIAKFYPEMFDYVGLFSAAVFRGNPDTSVVYRNPDERLDSFYASKPKLVWIGIGKEDFLYKENVRLREQLDTLGYPYIYHESEGGHIWRNWRDYLVIFTEKLFK